MSRNDRYIVSLEEAAVGDIATLFEEDWLNPIRAVIYEKGADLYAAGHPVRYGDGQTGLSLQFVERLARPLPKEPGSVIYANVKSSGARLMLVRTHNGAWFDLGGGIHCDSNVIIETVQHTRVVLD